MLSSDSIDKLMDIKLSLFVSPQFSLSKFPINKNIFNVIDEKSKYPSRTTLNELGLWWLPTNNLALIYQSREIFKIFKSWTIEDIESGFLYFYYNIFHELGLSESKVLNVCEQFNLPVPTDLSNEFDIRMFELEVLQFSASIPYWNDQLEGYPVNKEFNQLNYTPCQFCVDELMFSKSNFKLNLIKRYCKNWVYNEAKSSASIMVFNKKSTALDPLTWHVIIRSPKKFGNDTFEVVLAHNNNRKMSPKHVVFQLFFPGPTLTQFTAGQLFNVWKTEVAFRYKYVERYIDYIEPLIAERMQGVE